MPESLSATMNNHSMSQECAIDMEILAHEVLYAALEGATMAQKVNDMLLQIEGMQIVLTDSIELNPHKGRTLATKFLAFLTGETGDMLPSIRRTYLEPGLFNPADFHAAQALQYFDEEIEKCVRATKMLTTPDINGNKIERGHIAAGPV